MVKIVDLAELGELKSQEQIDSHTKQCIVGEPLLDFESLTIDSGHVKLGFQTEILHEIIESLTIHLYQLLDESEEKLENEEEIQTYLINKITNDLRLLKARTDDNLQSICLLFDAYLQGDHSPEILTTAFILCSMNAKSDNQPNPIDFTLDRFIEYYQTHSAVLIQALKHAWNPMLDERLKKKLDEAEDLDLNKDIEAILRFRKENLAANHVEDFMH